MDNLFAGIWPSPDEKGPSTVSYPAPDVLMGRSGSLPGWQLCRGISGSFRVEWVAGFVWNQWQPWSGIRINALIHNDPVFSEQSFIREQPDCPDALLRCELVTQSDDLPAAVQHFYAQWFEELRYSNSVLELLNLEMHEDTASIHVLTISKVNAMTFVFNIQRGA